MGVCTLMFRSAVRFLFPLCIPEKRENVMSRPRQNSLNLSRLRQRAGVHYP